MKSVLSLSILIAASVVATAQGTSLLDGVLDNESPVATEEATPLPRQEAPAASVAPAPARESAAPKALPPKAPVQRPASRSQSPRNLSASPKVKREVSPEELARGNRGRRPDDTEGDSSDCGFTLSCQLLRLNFPGGEIHAGKGLELSGVAFDNVDFSGLRISGLDAVYGDMEGVQVSAVLNIAGGDFTGFQGAFCANGVGGTMSGVQISAVNYCETLDGLQIGLLNIAEYGKGVQIGFLNIIADSSLPVFPIINARF